MIRNIRFLFMLYAGFLVGSCGSYYKHVPYFKDLPAQIVVNQDIENNSPLIIQPNDILEVKVSSLSPETYKAFNPPSTIISINTSPTEIPPAEGFLVNQQGEVQIPLIGSIVLSGLTTIQAINLLTLKLAPHLKNPVVNVRVLNFTISVFGDVRRPGIYTVNNERFTVIEAIVRAGDLNPGAMRKNILLVREIAAKRQFIRLDISSQSIFKSPYLYLKNNDMIYIEPGNIREKRDQILSNTNVATAIVTFVLLLLKFK